MSNEPSDDPQTGNAPPANDRSGTKGEDDSSTERNGDDSHLHDDQKSQPLAT